MSHGDRVTRLPEGFRVYAVSENAPYAVAADEARRYYTTMFHPEVVHTPDGAKLLANFLFKVAGLKGDWTMAAFRDEEIARIRAQVGKSRVICGLSGGVDSAVAAVLIHEAIGDQLVCVFVDHGLMRQGEADEVVGLFRGHFNIPLFHVDASRSVHSRRSQASKTPRPSARRSAGCSSTRSRRRRAASRATAKGRSTFWRRARSIPT